MNGHEIRFTFFLFPIAMAVLIGSVVFAVKDASQSRSNRENLQRELACIESGRDFINGQCRNAKEPKP